MAEFSVLDINGKKAETFDLPDDVFGKEVNTSLLHQALVMYQACLRQGNAATKERAYVSGGGQKPYRQKGTGRARAGSSRSPLWIGGGTTFGPHPRSYRYTVPRKIKKAALRESLNAKIKNNNLICINDIQETFQKTKEFVNVLKKLNLKGKILALLDGSNASIIRATRNIASFQLMRSQDVNAYDVLKYKKILVTKSALQNLLNRIK